MENESIFKFKRAKKMIGDFDADEQKEWVLLIKPQIGNVTLFTHFHKMWLVDEVPPTEEDEENGIEYSPGVQRQPLCMVTFGFIKDDKFVVERSQNFTERTDELANKTFVRNLEKFVEDGFTKDWANYEANGDPKVPDYYSHKQEGSKTSGPSNHSLKMMKSLQSMVRGGPKVIQAIQQAQPNP